MAEPHEGSSTGERLMHDRLDRQRRSENMRRIRGTNTKPEVLVRKALTKLGYRYRLHSKTLPGKPDIVFPGRKKLIFVHGCFWHQHEDCREGRIPNSRKDYWEPKLVGNMRRDHRNRLSLAEIGWQVLVVWECQIANEASLEIALREFLES